MHMPGNSQCQDWHVSYTRRVLYAQSDLHKLADTPTAMLAVLCFECIKVFVDLWLGLKASLADLQRLQRCSPTLAAHTLGISLQSRLHLEQKAGNQTPWA